MFIQVSSSLENCAIGCCVGIEQHLEAGAVIQIAGGQGNTDHTLRDGIIRIGLELHGSIGLVRMAGVADNCRCLFCMGLCRETLLGLHHGESQSSHQRNQEKLLYKPVIYKINVNNSTSYQWAIIGMRKDTKFSSAR